MAEDLRVETVMAETDRPPDPAPEETPGPEEAAAPPAPEPEPCVDPLLEAVRLVKEELAALHAAFDDKIRYDDGQQRLIDRLHADLQEHKAGLVLDVLRPIALDLIRLHDDLGQVAAGRTAGGDGDGDGVVTLLAGFQVTVEEILERYGFEGFHAEPPTFDPRLQRAVRSVPTDDPARNRQVADRLRKGFRYRNRVVRPELVTVYVSNAAKP